MKPKHIREKPFIRAFAILLACLACLCVGGAILSDTSTLTFEPESLVSFDRDGELLSFFVNERDNFKVSLQSQDLPAQLQQFVLLYEDKRFFTHAGVDPLALARTIWGNLAHAKRHGASTITMQVAKLGSQQKRTWWNKFTQSLQALRLEWQKDKPQILRLYLDNTPYGSNIVGVKSAALLYFKKPLHRLSPAQNALLAIMPNTPNLIFTNPAKLLAKRDSLLKRALDSHLITDMEYRLALLEPLPALYRSNSIAPHASLWLARHNPGTKVFHTTLHKPTQELLESKLREFATIIQDKGVHNLAALVLDSRDGAIVGYAGSQDFYDLSSLGAIDGVQAARNVGSTLKPFLYALALDSGLIIPQTNLADSNQFYGNFNPHNASRRFYGSKSALFCLRNSLNAPFVALLQDYGVEEFFYFLRANAPFSERDFAQYGLSLILGTKELSLFQLAKLYLGLRHGGDFSATPHALARATSPVDSSTMTSSALESSTISPPKSTQAPSNLTQDYINNSTQTNFTLSKEAAYLTLQSLLNLPLNARSSRFAHKIAWKSGTSFGNRDSWAIGISDRYVVAVWGGNFSAKASVNLTGREIAGVAMFDIFELLHGDSVSEFGSWAQVGKWSNKPKMREVRIDKNGYRVQDSSGGDSSKQDSSSTTPSSKIAYMPYYAKPLRTAAQAPRPSSIIAYPTPGIRFSRATLASTHDENTQEDGVIALLQQKMLAYFFLNGEFIGANDLGRMRLSPINGTNLLYIITQNGQSSSVEFEVLAQ